MKKIVNPKINIAYAWIEQAARASVNVKRRWLLAMAAVEQKPTTPSRPASPLSPFEPAKPAWPCRTQKRWEFNKHACETCNCTQLQCRLCLPSQQRPVKRSATKSTQCHTHTILQTRNQCKDCTQLLCLLCLPRRQWPVKSDTQTRNINRPTEHQQTISQTRNPTTALNCCACSACRAWSALSNATHKHATYFQQQTAINRQFHRHAIQQLHSTAVPLAGAATGVLTQLKVLIV